MGDTTLMRKKKGKREFWRMFAFAILILFFYTILYVYEPFSTYWNDLFSGFFTIFAAAFSAVFATLVFRRYEVSDAPRWIWLHFSIGLWLWALAEFIWVAYPLFYGEARINSADFFWIIAYAFFGYAVYLQYQIVFRPTPRRNIFWVSAALALAVILTCLTVWLLETFVHQDSGLPLWIAAFYPVADLVVGLAALRIVVRFRGGALGYPWLGLFIFAIADMLYAIRDISGIGGDSNVLSAVADITYLTAYLFVGLGCFAQLLLLRYGPVFTITRKESKKTI